jgi:chemotaxis regulatin CheY-phosphate phosphatase CheZ
MARRNTFELDLTPLVELLKQSPDAAAKGATMGMRDIKDDWVRAARDIAPHDTGNLRRQINGSVEGSGLESAVEIEANAMNSQRFNYAYYIHEGHMKADGKSLRHAGTVEEFLNEPAEKNERRWSDMLEREISEQLEREGW